MGGCFGVNADNRLTRLSSDLKGTWFLNDHTLKVTEMEPTGIEPVTSCLQSRSGVAEGRRLALENRVYR